MRNLISRISIFLFIFFSGKASAQILPFHSYGIEQGLVSDALTSLYQDSKGYLWIGTGDGISVFDGATFHSLRAADGLALNHVTHITESHRTPGEMLIGTWGGGINRFRDGAFETLLPDSSSRAKTIRDVEEDQQGTVWCVADSGVYRSNNGKSGKFAYLPGSHAATDLLISGDSVVWIAIGTTIVLCASGSGEELGRIDIPGSGEATSMHEDRTGAIWIATTDSLLVQIRGRKIAAQRKIPFGLVRSIFEDAHGMIWLATTNGILGISRDASTVIRYTKENGLRSNEAVACLVDFEDNLWIGFLDAGLIRLSDRNVYSFPLPGILDSYNNSRAVTDDRGHIWTIIDGAIVEVWRDAAGTWSVHRNPIPVVNGISIPTIDRDLLGRIWVDTRRRIECYAIVPSPTGPSGLHLVESLEPGHALPAGPRFFFVLDSKLNLWVSVVGEGVYKVSTTNRSIAMRHFSLSNGLPSNDIRVIYEDRRNDMWLGAVSEGLAVIRNGSDTVSKGGRGTEGLSDNLIRAVVEDAQERLWVGTRRKGIEITNGEKICRVSVEEGLLGSAVWALAADEGNNLIWAGTSQGVERIQTTSLTPVRSNSLLIGKPVTSLGIHPGHFLWYVTKEALTIYEFQPEMVNRSSPRTQITKVLVNGQPISLTSLPNFTHDENLFTFEYVGISFREPEAVRYQSRLVGVEKEWQAPTPQRTVTYASLSPGSYTYEVRTINANGIMNDPPAKISFTIFAPFWARWWFIGGGTAIVIGTVVLTVRRRVKRLLEIERLRSRIARDLHDEIGSNLSSIAMASDLLLRHARFGEGEYNALSKISSIALGTVKNMKDIVWLLHPGNDTLDNLFLRMKDVAGSLLEGVQYTISFPPMTDERKVTLEWKRNVYLIFKESLTNVMKHAGATSVEIVVQVHGDRLAILIRDNGIGFDPNNRVDGNGLRNLRERALLLRAGLGIDTRQGAGTCITLETEIT